MIDEINALIESSGATKLTEFFKLCLLDADARQYTYHEIPSHYVWKDKSWSKRRNHTNTVGRMYFSNPSEGERFYLRMLLCHVKGPTSFRDLKTVENVEYATFKDSAIARGLLENDREWDHCLEESSSVASPKQLRDLFATLLVFCHPGNVGELFQRYFITLSDDFRHEGLLDDAIFYRTAKCINDNLSAHGKAWRDFTDLPDWDPEEEIVGNNPLLDDETTYDQAIITRDMQNIDLLNVEQKALFDAVVDRVENPQESNVFFVDGPGGSGKTFCYNSILAYHRSRNKVCLSVASSGIAACLLYKGKTAHSAFGIPLELDKDSSSSIKVNSNKGDLLKQVDLIVWDEAPMMHKHSFECVDRLLRDITGNDTVFGGKVVLFGGDFRQILPVVVNGNRAQVIAASLKKSYIWDCVKTYKLIYNMRLNGPDAVETRQHANYLLSVGEGTNGFAENCVLPQNMALEDNTLEKLIDYTYPGT